MDKQYIFVYYIVSISNGPMIINFSWTLNIDRTDNKYTLLYYDHTSIIKNSHIVLTWW